MRNLFYAKTWHLCLLGAALALMWHRSIAEQFEDLGIPVRLPLLMGTVVGTDEQGEDTIYFNCAQPGAKLFLLQVNPKTDKTRQFGAPVGEGAWAMILGPDKCIYLGTWESGYLLKFDPRHPDDGIESLGKPSATESYIWQLALGTDQRLYGCTFPEAKLVRYDPATGKSEDLGRLDNHEMYARSVAASTNGFIYVGIGTMHAQIVRFDPVTGQSRPLLAEDQRPPGTATVFQGADGRAYASVGADCHFFCDGDALVDVKDFPPEKRTELRDRRFVYKPSLKQGQLSYEISCPGQSSTKKTARFEAAGIGIFSLGAGPNGRIFGSTAMPLEMFPFTPARHELKDVGNPTALSGEIYSFATDGKLLYTCAYPGSYLSIYDPEKPWNYGTEKGANPRCRGPMGDGQLRPCAMVVGDDGRVYVGSLPPYGQTGGVLGVYDPRSDAVVENYRNIVTNQGITTLCLERNTGRIFGGSSIEGGGGARPIAKECVLFAWDAKEKKKKREQVPEPGDTVVVGLVAAHGKVFAISRPSNTLLVINPKYFVKSYNKRITDGLVHEASLIYDEQRDCLLAFTATSILSVDPETCLIKELARSPIPITRGFAVTDTGIYFASHEHLYRWH
jgi:hypothetical protein